MPLTKKKMSYGIIAEGLGKRKTIYDIFALKHIMRIIPRASSVWKLGSSASAGFKAITIMTNTTHIVCKKTIALLKILI